jgi:cytochrome c biogenesis protein CcmG/thiol:disulfide interchange protein DsbE
VSDPSAAPPATGDAVVVARSRNGTRTAVVITVLLGIVVAALVVLLATRDPAGERASKSRLIGRTAPATAGTTIDGQHVSIDEFRGRWVVVNFFGSWCTPCLEEQPELQAFDEEHRTLGDAVLIGVTFDDKLKDAKAFFAKNGGDWPVINDPENSIGVAYGIAQVPESWLIAPDGTIVYRFANQVTRKDLDDALVAFTTPSGGGS